MKPKVYTFDSVQINSGSPNYKTTLLLERGANSSQVYFEGGGDDYPRYLGKTVSPFIIALHVEMLGTYNTQYDVIAKLFQLTHGSTKRLVVLDEDDSNKDYYLDVVVKSFQRLDYKNVKVVLGATEGYWTAVDKSTTTKSVTASGDKANVATGTNTLDTHPIIKVTPTSAGSVSAKAQFVLVTNTLDTDIEDYGYDFGEAAFDTATIVTAGDMDADGGDLILEIDGVEQSRWLVDINTDHTKVWGLLNLSAKKEVSLSGAIADSGAVTSIISKNDISDWPDSGRFVIGTELFIYSSKDDATKTFTVSEREAYESTAAAHSDDDDIKWVEHEIWFKFGGDEAMEADETIRPMFDTATSSNTSHVYTSFRDTAGLRASLWTHGYWLKNNNPSGTLDGTADWYTANQGTYADPASEMGGHVGVEKIGVSAAVNWNLYNPLGLTHVAATGIEIWQQTAEDALYSFRKSSDGSSYSEAVAGGTSAVEQAWQSMSNISNTSLGATYKYLRWQIECEWVSQELNSYAEVSAVTVTVDSSNLPDNDLITERTIYNLNATIKNNTRGEEITLTKTMELDETVQVDCTNNKITYSGDGDYHYEILTNKNTLRKRIMTLDGGATDEIEYEQTGTGNVTLVIDRYDRKPL